MQFVWRESRSSTLSATQWHLSRNQFDELTITAAILSCADTYAKVSESFNNLFTLYILKKIASTSTVATATVERGSSELFSHLKRA